MKKEPGDAYSYRPSTAIEWLMKNDILLFNKESPFKLKSGGTSTYFFNTGNINKGGSLATLGLLYQQQIREIIKNLDQDIVVFGSAYKGIPICTVVAQVLDTMNSKRNAYYCFDRKEEKDHGDGGKFVGKDMKGMYVIIVDDVLTSGGSLLQAAEKIKKWGGNVVGACVLIDRMEPGDVSPEGDPITMLDVVSKQLGIDIVSIINVETIAINLIESNKHTEECYDMLRSIGRYNDQKDRK